MEDYFAVIQPCYWPSTDWVPVWYAMEPDEQVIFVYYHHLHSYISILHIGVKIFKVCHRMSSFIADI